MKKRLSLLLFSLLLATFVDAQFVLTPNVKLAYTNIYSLHLDQAQALILAERKANPNNTFLPYLLFNLAFAEVFISEREELYNQKEEQLDNWIDQIKDIESNSPWRGFCLTEMYMLRSSLKLKFGLTVKAGFDAMKAYKIAEEMESDFPDFSPQWLSWGLINVAVGSVPDNYKFAVSTLGFEGDIEKGIELLEKSWADSQVGEFELFKDKSTLVYGYILQQVAGQDSLTLDDLKVDYKNNSLLIYLQAKMLNSQRRNIEVIELLENRPISEAIYPFYYLDFMEGRAKLAGMRKDAAQPFLNYLENYRGKHFIKAVHYYLSVFYFLEGNTAQANYHKKKVFSVGHEFTGADKMALFMANRPFNKTLLKAQNYFDNGSYQKAIKELNSTEVYCKNRTDSIEMFYRRGRVYQALEDEFKAIVSYKMAINLNGDFNSYYAANSALYLAKMFEEKRMNASARYYYKLTLKYKNYPFIEGNQQQAKAGKKRVE